MNVIYVVCHEQASSFVSVYHVVTFFRCGCVKRSILYEVGDLRLIICECCPWEIALNVGVEKRCRLWEEAGEVHGHERIYSVASDENFRRILEGQLNPAHILAV